MEEKHFNVFLVVSIIVIIGLLIGIAGFLISEYIKDKKLNDNDLQSEKNDMATANNTILNESMGFNSNNTEVNNTVPDEEIICGSDYYNCEDFESYDKAKKVYDACFGQYGDIHRIDSDGDGIPCEGLY